jgi:hypothetical protein
MSEIVGPYGGFPFFGTLLGLFRDGHLIDGDDDIDFAIDSSKLDRFLQDISSDSRFELMSSSEYEGVKVQISLGYTSVAGESIVCDVFGYIWETNCAIFPVHWRDEVTNQQKWLRVPWSESLECELRQYLKPKGTRNDKLKPLIEFLYGVRWDSKLLKNVDYRVEIRNGRPEYEYFRGIKRLRLKAAHSFLARVNHQNPKFPLIVLLRIGAHLPKRLKDMFFRH